MGGLFRNEGIRRALDRVTGTSSAAILSQNRAARIDTGDTLTVADDEGAAHQDVVNALRFREPAFERRGIEDGLGVEDRNVGIAADLDAALGSHGGARRFLTPPPA